VLAAATVAIAAENERVSSALTAAGGALHLSIIVVGVIMLALIGTVADLFWAVFFAR